MTVSSQTIKVTYNGNGSTTLFPITFAYNADEEIGVYYTSALGVITKITTNLIIDTVNDRVEYPVDSLINPVLVTGTKLTLIRETSIDQGLDLTGSGYFTAVQAENAYDKITRIAQELGEKLSRCVSYPLNETPTVSDTDTFLTAIETARDLAIAAQVAAEAAKVTTESALDSFDDRYLGSKVSDPTLDNDGDALLTGCLYFNSVLSKMRIWNGVAWESITAGAASIKFTLLNNQALTDITGLLFNNTTEKSVFLNFEIERVGSSEYRQIISAQAFYDGTNWAMTFGNFSGSDLIQDALTTDESITLSITSGGQIQYSSGNLAGHTSTILKVIQSKMEV